MARTGTRALLVLALILVVISAARNSSAARYGQDGVTLDLGDGMSATASHSPCGGAVCVTWTARGFWTPATSLRVANMYANAGVGRIVAAFNRAFGFTDDRGRTWRIQALERGAVPLALAFDVPSGFGAAVGTGGSLWTSEDRGATWSLRRSGTGVDLVEVVVRRHAIAFASSTGAVGVSFDGGTSVRELVHSPEGLGAALVEGSDAIWVGVSGRWLWRVMDGWVEPANP